MLTPGRSLRVFAFGEPVDMRKSYNSLFALVRDQLQLDPLSGHYFLFVGRTRRLAKVLMWDGTGLCLYSKRLEAGRFVAPWQRECSAGSLEMTASELALLLEGSVAVKKVLSPAPVVTNSQKNAFQGSPKPANCDRTIM